MDVDNLMEESTQSIHLVDDLIKRHQTIHGQMTYIAYLCCSAAIEQYKDWSAALIMEDLLEPVHVPTTNPATMIATHPRWNVDVNLSDVTEDVAWEIYRSSYKDVYFTLTEIMDAPSMPLSLNQQLNHMRKAYTASRLQQEALNQIKTLRT